ncbi:MAG: class I SAM-dependent methyltransferase [Rhizobiaceae bacterium]
MSESALYDKIGINYANLRKPDSRIAATINAALDTAKTVLNVGAGAGSYEPENRVVTALEPSLEMIRQRSGSTAHVVQGSAEHLPFDDRSFDAAMAVLTIHHWTDQTNGVAEMQRVARDKLVFLTFDPAFHSFWLADYFPALITMDEAQMPQISDYQRWLGSIEVTAVPIPQDCTDGFLAGYWKRPQAYLDDRVRAAMSSFWALDNVEQGLEDLRSDLQSGAWNKKYAHLQELEELDCGYRLIVAG